MARLYILQLVAAIAGGFMAARKGRSALFWFLLCFILPLFALVIFMLPSLKAEAAGRKCPNCLRPLAQDDRCGHCGWQKTIELVQCRTCGSFLPEHENCPTCSRKR